MLMDVVSIGSFLAFWVVITLAGYWGVTRVSKMRAEKREGIDVHSSQDDDADVGAVRADVHGHRRTGEEAVKHETQDQVSRSHDSVERSYVHRYRGTVQASVTPGYPVVGQSARDGYSRFQHLDPFRANPR